VTDLRAEARRRAEQQRIAQGLPRYITDPDVLRLAADALASATPSPDAAPDRRRVDATGEGIGAAGLVRGSASPARSHHKKTPLAATSGVQNNAAS
jgi:hypothetical protein